MSEPNGSQESGNALLDRIEHILNKLPDYRMQFREEYELLLSAQVQMQGGLEQLRKDLESLARTVEAQGRTVEAQGRNIDAIGRNIELMRQNFDERLKRIEPRLT